MREKGEGEGEGRVRLKDEGKGVMGGKWYVITVVFVVFVVRERER